MKMKSLLELASFGVKTVIFKKKDPILGTVILTYREMLAEVMEENNVDAIMFLQDMSVPIHDGDSLIDNYAQINQNSNSKASLYARYLGAYMGCPDMVLPMGFSETDESCSVPMPVGMHFLGKYGSERTLMQIAYAYEQQAGPDVRQQPSCTPALQDANLNAYLEALMDEVYCIDYSVFGSKPEGKVRLMEHAYDRAAAVDLSDPYAVYNAAYDLARAYDKTIAALKGSGLNLASATVKPAKTQYTYTGRKITPTVKVTLGGITLNKDQDYKVTYKNNLNAGTASIVISSASTSFVGSKTASFKIGKGKTVFKAKAAKPTITYSKLKTKEQTVAIRVSGLSQGSSKVSFSVRKVTNGQKPGVKVNSKTGKVTIKKNTKKCTIFIKATSKGTGNRKAATKTVKIRIK